MTGRADLDQSYLCSVLRYEAETGNLYWRRRHPSMFNAGGYSSERASNAWNAKFADKPAFTAISKGYKTGRLNGATHAAHRVIWVMCHGTMPDFIDHENGDRSDNRLSNLRAVTHLENNRNRCISRNNTSGVIGVSWDSHYGKWVAMLKLDNGKKRTRYCDTVEEAAAFRKRLEAENNYHPNHGRQAEVLSVG